MKAKVAAGAIIAIVVFVLIGFAVSQSRAQADVDSAHLAKFAAIMQYIRSEPTPADVKADNIPLLATLDTNLSDIYITGFITPYTGETPEQVKARLQSVPEEDRFIAVMVESYRLASNPLLLDIIHQLLPLYYIDYFTTSDLGGAPDFMKRADIQSLADDAFDSSNYAIPAPSTTGSPQPTPTSTTIQPTPDLHHDTAHAYAHHAQPRAEIRPGRPGSGLRRLQHMAGSAGILPRHPERLPRPRPRQRRHSLRRLVRRPAATSPAGSSYGYAYSKPDIPRYNQGRNSSCGTRYSPWLYRGVVQPGRYSSLCRWERWRFNNPLKYRTESDSHYGAGYQFYVRVLDTDYELVSTCQLTRATDFTRPPTSSLPDTIKPGMYLVNVEIRPGLYRGVVPSEGSSTSCRWTRHADYTGVYGERIDSDSHSTDGFEFSLSIASDDFGFATSCELTREQ